MIACGFWFLILFVRIFSSGSVLFAFEIWLMFVHWKIQLIEEYCFIANITSVSTVNENWLIYCGYESQKFTYHNIHLFKLATACGPAFNNPCFYQCFNFHAPHLDPSCKKTVVVKFETKKHCCIAIKFCGFAITILTG